MKSIQITKPQQTFFIVMFTPFGFYFYFHFHFIFVLYSSFVFCILFFGALGCLGVDFQQK